MLQALLDAGTPVVSHLRQELELHVKEALGVPLEENLEIIDDTVRFLKQHVDEVIYDAEHFFDGYADNPEYAIRHAAGRAARRAPT